MTGACAGKVITAGALHRRFRERLAHWLVRVQGCDGERVARREPLAIASPGANGTSKAIHLSGSGLPGIRCRLRAHDGLRTDTSAFQGITFWAKGTSGTSNDIALQVAIPQTQAVADLGDCTSKCYDHPSKRVGRAHVELAQQYVQKFADLAQAGFGTPATYGGVVMALNWVSIEGPSLDFQVDEISFY